MIVSVFSQFAHQTRILPDVRDGRLLPGFEIETELWFFVVFLVVETKTEIELSVGTGLSLPPQLRHEMSTVTDPLYRI